ncbi:Ada metal-binding domain-containing protein [Mucilaginibacter sp. SG564]|uniref:Ada metal-binding domain-containing protein n=1 Tax=unclassified Mucilaginibacter TaxID=2617802 RepID=UPI00155656AE|nr:Ada metal-binding domain-containing protein [Mucilaginibacter sp. SG564]NOW97701.1 methylphosphotriester-DNA--protein-cysteine methyltransferase [Mucilaginibacter sp. SG564]
MIRHLELGYKAFTRSRKLKQLLDAKQIWFGGNARLKIYGTMNCGSGKRMKPENRVFFTSEAEARSLGYRPCGHCMRAEYQRWKNSQHN